MSDLKEKVFTKIDDQKPTSVGYFVALDWIRAFLITVVLFLGGILLAFLLWDWILIPQIIDFTVDNLLYISLRLLPLVIILIIISSLIGYVLYRQTDWPLVQKRGLVVGIAAATLLIVTILSLAFIRNNLPVQKSLRDIDDKLQQSYPVVRPPRPRGRNIPGNVPAPEIVLGKIAALENKGRGVEIILETRIGQIILLVNTDMTQGLKEGDLVRLDLDPQDLKKVTKITVLEAPNNNTKPGIISHGTCKQDAKCKQGTVNIQFELK